VGGASDAEINAAVRKGRFDFKDPAWAKISVKAKKLIRRMLEAEPSKRADVTEILATPWVCVGDAAPAVPLPSAINEKLRSFNEARRTWKAAIRAASLIGRAPAAAAAARSKRPFKPEALAPDVVEELRAAFAAYDTDGNGTIDLAELKQMMVALGAPEGEAERQMAAVDTSGNGVVTFAMFCTAVGPIYEHSDSALRRAFGLFDVDGSGFIEKNEVRGMLTKLAFIQADAPDSVVDKVMAFADADGDGRVSYEEFVSIFASGKDEMR